MRVLRGARIDPGEPVPTTIRGLALRRDSHGRGPRNPNAVFCDGAAAPSSPRIILVGACLSWHPCAVSARDGFEQRGAVGGESAIGGKRRGRAYDYGKDRKRITNGEVAAKHV